MNMRCSPFHVHLPATLVAALNRQTFINWLSMVCFMSHLPFLIFHQSFLFQRDISKPRNFEAFFPWAFSMSPHHPQGLVKLTVLP